MILIFGGAYQGKLDYALSRFGLTKEDVHQCDEDCFALKKKKIIYEIDKWILALVKADADVGGEVHRFIDDHVNAIVICNDISCGVVPIGATLRAWREAVGRSLGTLSRASDEVIRVFCGIPARLK